MNTKAQTAIQNLTQVQEPINQLRARLNHFQAAPVKIRTAKHIIFGETSYVGVTTLKVIDDSTGIKLTIPFVKIERIDILD